MSRMYEIYCLATHGNHLIVGDSFGKLHWIDMQSNQVVNSVQASATGISALAFNPDASFMLTGDFDGVVDVWNITDGQNTRLRSFKLSRWIAHFAFSSTENLLAISHEMQISIFNTKTWQQEYVVTGFTEPISACFVKNERVLWMGGREGGFGQSDYANNTLLFYSKMPYNGVTHILEEDVVYIWDFSGVYQWDSKYLSLIAESSLPAADVSRGDIDFERKLLVFGVHEGEIGVYSIKDRKMLAYIKTPETGIYHVILSPDKRSIFAGMKNGLVGKWNTNDFSQEAILSL